MLKDGREPVYPEAPPAALRDTMRAVPVSFGIAGTPERVRVIGIQPGQLITDALVEAPTLADGHVVADPSRDLAKIAVIERHHGTGRVGLGLVRGFGLTAGAFASTVAHDAHNLVVVGVDDARHGAVRRAGAGARRRAASSRATARSCGELALPIAGLLSDRPLEEVAEGLEGLQDLLGTMGVTIEAPFMTLSFLALSVIPSLKITDRGLVDVDAFALVPLALNGRIELEREAFVERFGGLYEHSPWVAEDAWRPSFSGLDELAAALRDAMYAAPRDAQLALIRAHPDLGEKVGVLTEHSASEQAGLGLDRLSPADHERFMATNAAYREKFGIPFVVCVREHGSAESILANADSRLGNTTEQEIETALGEIAKIARLRLEDAL